MSTPKPQDEQDAPGADDLKLVPDSLEDEGKDEAEIWSELDAEEGVAPASQVAAEEEASGEDADEAAAEAELEKGATSAADGAAEDPNKAKPGTAEPGTKGKDEQAAPDKGAAANPNANLPNDVQAELKRLREENERLAQSDRSNRGRISALQRKLDGGGKPPGSAQGLDKGPKKAFQSEKGKEFVNEYPDVAAPVAAEIEAVRSEVAELKEARQREEEAAELRRLKKNEEVLEKAHPGWATLAAAPEFAAWVESQPRYVQEAAERNNEAIVDAQEAADLIGRFKAFRSSESGRKTQEDGPSDGKPADEGKNGNALSGRRQRQLASQSGARPSGPAAADGIPEDGDEEAIWHAMDRVEARQRQRA